MQGGISKHVSGTNGSGSLCSDGTNKMVTLIDVLAIIQQ